MHSFTSKPITGNRAYMVTYNYAKEKAGYIHICSKKWNRSPGVLMKSSWFYGSDAICDIMLALNAAE